jgi:hypothetical protein
MENFTPENLTVLWLASLKLVSIWWPCLLMAFVGMSLEGRALARVERNNASR